MQIIKQIISTAALRVIGVCLLFLMHIYFSRTFGVDTYGLLSFAIASASLLHLFSLHGWPSGIVKLVSVYNKQKQWGLLKGVLFNSFWHSISLSIVISSVLLLLVYLGYFDNNISAGFFYAALMLPVLTASSIRKKIFLALNQPLGSIVPDDIFLPIIVCILIFLIPINQEYAVFIYFSAATIIMSLAIAWLWSIIPAEVKAAPVERMTKKWLGLILPMLFGGIGQILMNRTDVIMIGALLPIENAGIYSAAFRISLLTTFILGTVNMLLTPKLSCSYHLKDKANFDLYRKQALLFSSLGGLPVFIIIAIWPSELMSFFGVQYESYGNILIILAVGQLINALTGASSFILLMSGHEKYFAKSLLTAAFFNFIANYFAIMHWQIVGAAIVTAFTIAALNLVQFRKAMKIVVA